MWFIGCSKNINQTSTILTFKRISKYYKINKNKNMLSFLTVITSNKAIESFFFHFNIILIKRIFSVFLIIENSFLLGN